jgi:hypothetical protein
MREGPRGGEDLRSAPRLGGVEHPVLVTLARQRGSKPSRRTAVVRTAGRRSLVVSDALHSVQS